MRLSLAARRIAAAGLLAGLLMLPSGCQSTAGPLRGERDDGRSAARAEPSRIQPIEASIGGGRPPARAAGFGPEILEPSAQSGDDVVATVGGVDIRKSHVYDRLLETDRPGARKWLDHLVLDAVVAAHARKLSIELEDTELTALAEDAETELRTQIDVQWEGAMSFDDYLRQHFGLQPDAFREYLRLDLARMRYRGYVIRYLAMCEERVQVRFLVHEDPKLLGEVADRVRNGADFATMVRRHSTDPKTRDDGGLLPPFGRTFRHPIAKAAFELGEGELSQVVPFEHQGAERWALVYCLKRLPAVDKEFAAVRDEIRADLERRPVTEFESNAFALQSMRAADAGRAPEDGSR